MTNFDIFVGNKVKNVLWYNYPDIKIKQKGTNVLKANQLPSPYLRDEFVFWLSVWGGQ